MSRAPRKSAKAPEFAPTSSETVTLDRVYAAESACASALALELSGDLVAETATVFDLWVRGVAGYAHDGEPMLIARRDAADALRRSILSSEAAHFCVLPERAWHASRNEMAAALFDHHGDAARSQAAAE